MSAPPPPITFEESSVHNRFLVFRIVEGMSKPRYHFVDDFALYTEARDFTEDCNQRYKSLYFIMVADTKIIQCGEAERKGK